MSKAPVLFALLVAATAAALCALPSCTSGNGVTPSCIDNINDAGFMYPVDGGCYTFAVCPMGSPEACCGDGGVPLNSNMYAECLYGYGGCAQLLIQPDGKGGVVETCSATIVTGAGGGTSSSTGGGGTGGHSGAGGGTGGGG